MPRRGRTAARRPPPASSRGCARSRRGASSRPVAAACSPSSGPLAVVQTIVADGEVAGSAFCFLRDNKRAVGYRIPQQHWGRGIATAALAQLVAQIPERPLYATVAEHNPASLKVLEKSGFRRIGAERDGEVIMHVLRLD